MRKKHKLTREEKELCEPLLQELKGYEKAKIPIYVGGEKKHALDAAYCCMVREKGNYMGDYILDAEGRLTELHFDKVRIEEQ